VQWRKSAKTVLSKIARDAAAETRDKLARTNGTPRWYTRKRTKQERARGRFAGNQRVSALPARYGAGDRAGTAHALIGGFPRSGATAFSVVRLCYKNGPFVSSGHIGVTGRGATPYVSVRIAGGWLYLWRAVDHESPRSHSL
jgi:hypothetical protein